MIDDEDLLNLGGARGDKNAGDPLKYDHLTDSAVEITVFISGIILFKSYDEWDRRIHRVLSNLDESEKDR